MATVVRYLVDSLSFNIDATYPCYDPTEINCLLDDVTTAHDPEVVELLLKERANLNSPGLPHSPLLTTSSVKRAAYRRGSDERLMRVVNALLDYCADVLGSRETDQKPNGRLKPQRTNSAVVTISTTNSS